MPIEIKCSNPSCDASYVLTDDLAGKKVKCRQCGGVFAVPDSGAGEDEMALESGMPVGGDEDSPGYHPARQKCPNCGKMLGVAAITCPDCGADVRTGELRQEEKTRKSLPIKPIAKALVAVLLVAVVGYLLWSNRAKIKGLFSKDEDAVAKAEKEKAEEPEKEPERTGEPIDFDEIDKGKDLIQEEDDTDKDLKIEAPEITEAEARRLAPEEQRIIENVKKLWDLQAQAFNELTPKRWLAVYQQAREMGLEMEAQRAWAEAVKFRPEDPDINKQLGRVQAPSGQYATPEQVKFMERFQPSLSIRNKAFEELTIQLDGRQEHKLAQGRRVSYTFPEGTRTMKMKTGGRDAGTGEVSFTLRSGIRSDVTLLAEEDLPTFDNRAFITIRKAYDVWERDKQHSRSVREQRGWRREEHGWTVDWKTRSGREVVTIPIKYYTDDRENLLGIEVEDNRLYPPQPGKAPEIDYNSIKRQLVIKGTLVLKEGNVRMFSSGGEGAEANPVRIETSSSLTRPATFLSGHLVQDGRQRTLYRAELKPEQTGRRPIAFSYTRNLIVPEEVWSLVELEYPDIFEKRAQARLEKAEERLREAVEAEEAVGDVVGPMQRDNWINEKLQPVRDTIEFERKLHAEARAIPPFRDRIEVLRKQEDFKDVSPIDYQYINWQHFSHALGKAVVGSTRLMTQERMKQIEHKSQTTAEPTREPWAPPQGSPNAGEPLDAALNELTAFLRVAPESGFMPVLRLLEQLPNQQVMSRLIEIYQSLGTPAAAARLADITDSNIDVSLRVKALLALGQIGQDYALSYCRKTYVQPATRAASLSALVLAGDKTALRRLPEDYAKSNIEAQKMIFDHLLNRDSIAKVLALRQLREQLDNPEQAEQVAVALADHGGLVAVHTLGEMIKRDKRVYVKALRRIEPDMTTPLIRPLANIMRSSTQDRQIAAVFLGQSRNALAKDHLHLSAHNDHQASGALGLALLGTPDALKTVTDQIQRLDFNSMRVLRHLWQQDGELHAKWQWRAEVDQKAAKEFLSNVIFKSRVPRVRLAAAFMLAEMDLTPNRRSLVELATTPLDEYGVKTTAQQPGHGGFDPGMPPPEMGAPEPGAEDEEKEEKELPERIPLAEQVVQNCRDYRFIGPEAAEKDEPAQGGPHGQPGPAYTDPPGHHWGGPTEPGRPAGQPDHTGLDIVKAELPFGRALDFGSDPRLAALKLLHRVADGSVTDDLRRIATQGETTELRIQAMWTLGKLAGRESIETLINVLALPPAQFESLDDMRRNAMVRAGAARAIGKARYFKAVPKLLEVLKEEPPTVDAIQWAEERADEKKFETEAARWRAILHRGVCEALGDLCAWQPGYNPEGVSKQDYERARNHVARILLDQVAFPGKGYQEVKAEENARRLAAVVALGEVRSERDDVIMPLKQLADPTTGTEVSPEMRRAALMALINTGGRQTGDLVAEMIPDLMRDNNVKQLMINEVPTMARRAGASDMMLLTRLLQYLDQSRKRFVAETLLEKKSENIPAGQRTSFRARRAEILFEVIRVDGGTQQPQHHQPWQGQQARQATSIDQQQLEWYHLQRRCLEQLASQTTPERVEMLRKLADHPQLGVDAMLLLGKLETGYPLVENLRGLATEGKDASRRRAAVAALRRVNTGAAYDALEQVFLGQKQSAQPQDMHHPFPGHEPGRPATAQDGNPFRQVDEITLLAARCLATAGKKRALLNAFKSTRGRGGRSQQAYPDAVRYAAIYGFAYLPFEDEPLSYLQGKLRFERDEQMKRCLQWSVEVLEKRAIEEKKE